MIGVSAAGAFRLKMLPVSICSDTGPFSRPELCSWRDGASSSLQPAGVGGTGSRLVPSPGGRLLRGVNPDVRPDDWVSDGLLKLWDRFDDGGGPGGGGGNGIPGSH